MKITERMIKPDWWRAYLLLGLIADELLFYVLQAIVFVIRENSLPVWAVLCIDVVKYLIVILCCVLAGSCYRKGITEEKADKTRIFEWVIDGIYVYISRAAVKYLPMLISQYLALFSPFAAMIASIVAFLILLFVLMSQVWIAVLDLQVKQVFVKKGIILKIVWKCPEVFFSALAVFAAIFFGEILIDTIFLKMATVIGNSFAMQMLNKVCFGTLKACLLIWLVKRGETITEKVYAEEVPLRKTEIKKGRRAFVYIMVGIGVAYIGINTIYVFMDNPAENVGDSIEELMEAAKEETEFGNTDEAIRVYAKVETYLSALDYYANEDREALKKCLEQNAGDDFIWRLYYTMVNDVEMAKDVLIDSQNNTVICHDILQYYAGVETELSEEEKELVDDCIWICVSNGVFQKSTVKFDEASLRTKRINDVKALYEDTLSYNDLMLVLLRSRERGSVDENTAYQLLELAEANPEDAAYQLMAVLGGSQYLYDGAKHYGRVVECAKRLDNLMSDQISSAEGMVEYKLQLAQMVMNCDDYETALTFLEDVRFAGSTEVEDNILICYAEMGKQENVLKYTQELRKAGQERALIDYFAGLASLKLDDVDGALENAVYLAEKVLAEEDKREENNALLYNLVEYLCIRDSFQGYIDYSYRVTSYTEEQQAVIQKCSLLKNYINAVDAVYNSRNYEVAITSLEAVEEICPNMSMPWFLKGTAYFDSRDYDNALESYKKCISLDEDNMGALYSMAVIYDIKGEYDKSVQLCEQILEVLPEVNHEKDWYGISYHTRALYERIQKYIGGTK